MSHAGVHIQNLSSIEGLDRPEIVQHFVPVISALSTFAYISVVMTIAMPMPIFIAIVVSISVGIFVAISGFLRILVDIIPMPLFVHLLSVSIGMTCKLDLFTTMHMVAAVRVSISGVV